MPRQPKRRAPLAGAAGDVDSLVRIERRWPGGSEAVQRAAILAARGSEWLIVDGEHGERRRALDAQVLLVPLALRLTADALRSQRVVDLCAAVVLMQRANALHSDAQLLQARSVDHAGGAAAAVLVGDCGLSGAFRLLVSLRSLPVLETFAKASVLCVEGHLRDVSDPARRAVAGPPVATRLYEALAMSLVLLGEARCEEGRAISTARRLAGVARRCCERLHGSAPASQSQPETGLRA